MARSSGSKERVLQDSAKLIASIRSKLDKTQKELGKDLGVTQAVVSQWEQGDQYQPSAESWAKLGNLVPDHVIAAECWRRASVDRDRMLQVSELLLKEHGASIAGVQVVHVPSATKVLKNGKAVTPPMLPVPRWMLPKQEATYSYAEVQHFGMGPYLLGDVLLIEAGSEITDLREDSLVVIYRVLSRAAKVQERRSDEKFMAPHGWGALEESAEFGPQGLFVGKLRVQKQNLPSPGAAVAYFKLEESDPAKTFVVATREESDGKARMALDGDVQVLGRVIGWIEGPDEKRRLNHVLDFVCGNRDFPSMEDLVLASAMERLGFRGLKVATIRNVLRDLRDLGLVTFDEEGASIRRIRANALGLRAIEKQSFDPAVVLDR